MNKKKSIYFMQDGSKRYSNLILLPINSEDYFAATSKKQNMFANTFCVVTK